MEDGDSPQAAGPYPVVGWEATGTAQAEDEWGILYCFEEV